MERCICNLDVHWNRSSVHTNDQDVYREMDRVPNPSRIRAWNGNANGRSPFLLRRHDSISPKKIANKHTILQPIVAIQNYLDQSQVPIGMALVIFFNTFGGALFLSFAQTAFTNGLRTYIPQYAPGVNAQSVIAAGARAIKSTVPKDSIHGVLQAYNKRINHTFYIAAACAAMTFVFCWGLGWKSVKKPAKVNLEVKL